MNDRGPACPEEPLIRRLVKCRVLLYQEGLLTESEMKKIDTRIDRRAAELRGESEDTRFHRRFWKQADG